MDNTIDESNLCKKKIDFSECSILYGIYNKEKKLMEKNTPIEDKQEQKERWEKKFTEWYNYQVWAKPEIVIDYIKRYILSKPVKPKEQVTNEKDKLQKAIDWCDQQMEYQKDSLELPIPFGRFDAYEKMKQYLQSLNQVNHVEEKEI